MTKDLKGAVTDEQASISVRWQHQLERGEVTGACPVCGWTDGRGVRACGYSPNYGALTHQNTTAAAQALAPPDVRALWQSYDAHSERHGGPGDCSGRPHFDGPYRVACSGCATVVDMCDYGIDYDVG